MRVHRAVGMIVIGLIGLMLTPFAGAGSAAPEPRPLNDAGAPPQAYAPDFVSAAAFGAAINDAGDMVGSSYRDIGCGPFCLPPLDTVVWKAGVRIVLPSVPGLTGTAVSDINNLGWVSGYAGSFGFSDAVVWKPNGNSYTAIDLGVLPGTAHSVAIGIDDSNRVVGYATTSGGFTTPFMWTEAGGMVDLTTQGFPNETPLGISPGGMVATYGYWYHLGDPTSVTAMATPPRGFNIENSAAAINDSGDQARFLVAVSGENLVYPFRYHQGTWQQISTSGTGHLSRAGVGSINAAQDITVTVLSTAMIAYGPDGLAQTFDGLLSPAYDGFVTAGGPMNASGQILAQVIVGLEGRLMRLTPATSCVSSCIIVKKLLVQAKFHQDPNDPGHCAPGNDLEYNKVQAKLMVTSDTGARLGGVLVSGRFMDQYWTNKTVSGTTNAQGEVQFKFKDSCGVGAETFVVENATKGPGVFDKTVGVLTGYAIPQF